MEKTIFLNETVDINRASIALVSHLFYARILELEEEDEEGVIFVKQMQLKKLENEIENFIRSKPYSIVEICILDDENDSDYPRAALKLKNYTKRQKDKKPHYYKLVVDKTWGEYTPFQESADGVCFIKMGKDKK